MSFLSWKAFSNNDREYKHFQYCANWSDSWISHFKKTDSVGNLGILPFQNTGIFFFFFNYTDTKALDHET